MVPLQVRSLWARGAHKEQVERAAMWTHDPLNACASDNADGEVCVICQDTLSSGEGASAQLKWNHIANWHVFKRVWLKGVLKLNKYDTFVKSC